MQWLNGYKMRTVLVGCVVAVVLGGGSATADFTFGEPVNVGLHVNSSYGDCTPNISSDGLELFFDSDRAGGVGSCDLWMVTRSPRNDSWSGAVNLGSIVNSPYRDEQPYISWDGLELYFESSRPGGYGSFDIWVTTRSALDQPWDSPRNLGPPVNTSAEDGAPCLSADGLTLYLSSERSGGSGRSDLWMATRPTIGEPWSDAVNLGPIVNHSHQDDCPVISADGLRLFFASYDRPGGFGVYDIWMTTRATASNPWQVPINIGPMVNTQDGEYPGGLSSDERWLYIGEWVSSRPGGCGDYDLWQAPILPIVDLNGDGVVDSADMGVTVDYWGTDDPLCDIGPTPFGDGIVDVQDLIVLGEHLFEEFSPVE